MTAPITSVRASSYEVPTDRPESDGTLAWDSTTIVVVEVSSPQGRGIGWTYGHEAAAELVRTTLASVVIGAGDAEPRGLWRQMIGAVRNIGRQGIAALAISAVDIALWDHHARCLGLPLVDALGRHHDSVPAYGSGGFCTYCPDEVAAQLGGWAEAGFGAVKMKVARHPPDDPARLRAAREASGSEVTLMVDANGAFTYQQARRWAEVYADFDVRWYEEPVTSDDPAALRRLRSTVPPGIEVSAGEYGWDPWYFQELLAEEAVDCLQADVTRCGGFTGFTQVAAMSEAHHVDLSAHTAPLLSAHAGCATRRFRHLEWFHDHVRIERRLFDGFLEAADGRLHPDPDRPGLGVELRRADAESMAAGDREEHP